MSQHTKFKHTSLVVFAAVLSAALTIASAAPASAATVPASTVPASTVPASTVPAATVPAATVPAATPASVVTPAPISAGWRTDKAAWEGFFLDYNVGYSSVSGEDGPQIPPLGNSHIKISFSNTSSPAYKAAVNSNGGSGLATGLTIGYNIKGYVSLAADLAWQGSFTGGKTDMSGIGTGSLLLGLHPLRFWRKDLDFDVKLYGGYGIYEISYYYEDQTQLTAKGKSWLGTSIPLGLTGYYRIPGSAFVVGLDVRYVMAAYKTWMYNWDDDIKSSPDPAVETTRIGARLVLGGHF